MKPQLIRQLISGRVGKTLTITFASGEIVNAKIISADKDLEDDVDFYYIDLDRAPATDFVDGGAALRSHVYSGVYEEVREVEIPAR
ncbi:hypothetical protein HY251_10920 [bacterium]|nr:hypothetical protein [bacterium]